MPEPEVAGQIAIAINELANKIQILLEKQEELAENVSQIKEAVYNPDKGLYARLKELDMRLISLEAWKGSNTKFLWLVVTILVGLTATGIWQVVF